MTPRPLVRWQFEQGHRHLTCMVQEVLTSSSYEVAIVPLWDVARSAVETFDSPAAALQDRNAADVA